MTKHISYSNACNEKEAFLTDKVLFVFFTFVNLHKHES